VSVVMCAGSEKFAFDSDADRAFGYIVCLCSLSDRHFLSHTDSFDGKSKFDFFK